MSFSVQDTEADENSYTFIPGELQKHSRPSEWGMTISFVAYKSNINVCPITTLKEYLKRREGTLTLNITEKIFVTHRKPIREAQKETLSRWVEEVLKGGGINVNISKPHSCRKTSSSPAKNAGVRIEEALKQGKWSNCRTFQQYYYRDTEDINKQCSQSSTTINFNMLLLKIYFWWLA